MQGFNMGRYVPPDLEGTVSFNEASGKGHALGHRARKLATEGILTIIGQGVRFNAEKRKVGNYFSTPIWSFRFKHTLCGGHIEVRTDPKNAEYLVVEGGRRRDTGVDKVLDGEIDITRLGALSEEDKERFAKEGGFGALEKKVVDKTAYENQRVRLDGLLKASERAWADPYEKSRKLRAEFRVGRRKRQADERTGDALKEKFGLGDGMEMLSEAPEDNDRVKFVEFGPQSGNAEATNSSSKPMFRTSLNGDLPSRFKSGVKLAKLDRKEVLQSQLAGNTRIATDPFLREGDIWQPRVKRKRDEEVVEVEVEVEQKKAVKTDGLALIGYDSDSS
ncbi:Protein saf4 [Exophiala xenobiotica]|nr:Protein saf4 [Exophiala xenobiotica]